MYYFSAIDLGAKNWQGTFLFLCSHHVLLECFRELLILTKKPKPTHRLILVIPPIRKATILPYYTEGAMATVRVHINTAKPINGDAFAWSGMNKIVVADVYACV